MSGLGKRDVSSTSFSVRPKSAYLGYADDSLFLDDVQVVQQKLKLGADPNVVNKNGLTPLMNAIDEEYKNVLAIVKTLLEDPRLDVNIINQFGHTALMLASMSTLSDETSALVTKAILSHSETNPNIQSSMSNYTPALYAARMDKPATLKALIDNKKTDINLLSKDGDHVLSLSAESNHLSCVRTILTSTAVDPNTLFKGETAVHIAHKYGYKKVVVELLKHGKIDYDTVDMNGLSISTILKKYNL